MRIENRRYCRSIVFYQPDFSDEMFRFGQLSLLLAGLGLSYYTAWVILLPFVDPEYRPLVARLQQNLFKTHFHACPPPKKVIYNYMYSIEDLTMANSALDPRFFPPPALGLALPLGLGVSLFTILLCRAAYLVR